MTELVKELVELAKAARVYLAALTNESEVRTLAYGDKKIEAAAPASAPAPAPTAKPAKSAKVKKAPAADPAEGSPASAAPVEDTRSDVEVLKEAYAVTIEFMKMTAAEQPLTGQQYLLQEVLPKAPFAVDTMAKFTRAQSLAWIALVKSEIAKREEAK